MSSSEIKERCPHCPSGLQITRVRDNYNLECVNDDCPYQIFGFSSEQAASDFANTRHRYDDWICPSCGRDHKPECGICNVLLTPPQQPKPDGDMRELAGKYVIETLKHDSASGLPEDNEKCWIGTSSLISILEEFGRLVVDTRHKPDGVPGWIRSDDLKATSTYAAHHIEVLLRERDRIIGVSYDEVHIVSKKD